MSIQEQKITEAAIAANGVQSRPDKLTGTAAQNKKVFDALVTAVVREKFNALIDELTGTNAAAQLGIATISGFSADNIQTALEEIIGAMQEITQGSVADGSITLAKLAAEVTAIALGGAAASHTHGAGDISSGTLDSSRIPVLDASKLDAGSVGSSQLASSAVTTQKIKDAAVTADKIAALAVLAQHIANGAVTTQKLAEGAVTAEKIADGAITPASSGALPLAGGTMTGKMQNNYAEGSGVEVTHANAGTDCGLTINKASSSNGGALFVGVGMGGNAGIYSSTFRKWLIETDKTGNMFIDDLPYRHIYVGTGETPPSTWQPGDIYLQYE